MPGRTHPAGILPPALADRATPVVLAEVRECECPVDEDHNILCVFDGRRWRLLCTEGCSEASILEALGLPDNALHPTPVASVSYAYRAADGTLLFEVVRRPNQPKGWDRFYIREHAGCFESSLVYRLPDLIAAPLDEVIYWTEGEKDAEALIAHGLLAVTTSDGPVPYDPRKVVRWFKGRKVVLLPDNDEAGRLYAAKIEASLLGIAASVTRVEMPAGAKDVSEWLDAGGRLSDLIDGAGVGP